MSNMPTHWLTAQARSCDCIVLRVRIANADELRAELLLQRPLPLVKARHADPLQDLPPHPGAALEGSARLPGVLEGGVGLLRDVVHGVLVDAGLDALRLKLLGAGLHVQLAEVEDVGGCGQLLLQLRLLALLCLALRVDPVSPACLLVVCLPAVARPTLAIDLLQARRPQSGSLAKLGFE
eukprot:UN2411